jgi:LacI family transcriptional regulator
MAPLGANVEVKEFDRYNLAEFYRVAAEILSNKPDGLAMAPIMQDKMRHFVDEFDTAGIPYVFFDANIPDTRPLCVVGPDSYKGGCLAGRLMSLFAGTNTLFDNACPSTHNSNASQGTHNNNAYPGTAMVLDAHGEDYHIIQRRKGFLDYAAGHHFQAEYREYSGYTGIELSEKEIKNFLEKNIKEHFGIFVTNCLAFRVAKVAKSLYPERKFLLIGFDLIPANIHCLEEGTIDAIIAQRPEEQARFALLALYRHVVLHQDVEKRINIPLDIYIKENVPAALDAPAALDVPNARKQ